MRVVIFTPDRNKIKNDYFGAFKPEAENFRDLFILEGAKRGEIEIHTFPLMSYVSGRAKTVNDHIKNGGKITTLAFFCHGTRWGIQSGHTIKKGVHDGPRSIEAFAKVIGSNIEPTCNIVLYACSSGRGDEAEKFNGPGGHAGFASRLTKWIKIFCPEWRGWLDAHTTVGHTTQNPYVRRFLPEDETDDGFWLSTPNNPNWKIWVRDLKTVRRFRYPFWIFPDDFSTYNKENK